MEAENFDARLRLIEARLAEMTRVFERSSQLTERMVALEERDRHSDRRIDIAERALYDLNARLDARFEKMDARYDEKFEKVYAAITKLGDTIQSNTVKVFTLWGILSFAGAIGAVFLKELIGRFIP